MCILHGPNIHIYFFLVKINMSGTLFPVAFIAVAHVTNTPLSSDVIASIYMCPFLATI